MACQRPLLVLAWEIVGRIPRLKDGRERAAFNPLLQGKLARPIAACASGGGECQEAKQKER